MKGICLFIAVSLFACNGNTKESESGDVSDWVDGAIDSADKADNGDSTDAPLPGRTYSNKRFKDVRVQKIGEDRYVIEGKGQIFEANFGWVVEDGHRELKQGFEMTDAGAPAWGKFRFTVEVEKARPNSTLTLVLYESSAKDGSRQYELPIPLE